MYVCLFYFIFSNLSSNHAIFQEGLFKLYNIRSDEQNENMFGSTHRPNKKPTRITMCYFMGAAYVTSIGACGSILGSDTNLAFKYIYETKFGNQKSIDFFDWMYFNVPLMLINTIGTWIYLQWYFMGMFRPNSIEANQYKLGKEGEKIVRQVIINRYNELGPISQQEIQVAILFIVSIALYFLRAPGNFSTTLRTNVRSNYF